MKLLIVDDHAGMRKMIRQLADLPESAVRECGSGEAAIEIAREFVPDLVTMDVRLPGISGLEATRAIRFGRPATCIVVISAYNLPGLRVAARQAGAIEFLVKDDLEQLRLLLAKFRQHAPPSNSDPESSAADQPGK